MTYKEYPYNPHTYIVHHTTGFGEQGGEPIREHEIVYSSDSYEDCMTQGRKLYLRHQSGWTYDDFTINVNTSTPQGKLLLAEFRAKCDKLEQHQKENPHLYTEYKTGDYTLILRYHPELDGIWQTGAIFVP